MKFKSSYRHIKKVKIIIELIVIVYFINKICAKYFIQACNQYKNVNEIVYIPFSY